MASAPPLVTWMAALLLTWSCRDANAVRRGISDGSSATRSPSNDAPPYVFFAGGTYFFSSVASEEHQSGRAAESWHAIRMKVFNQAFGRPRRGQHTDEITLSSRPPPGLAGRPFAHAVATRIRQQLDWESLGDPRPAHVDDSLMYVLRLIGGLDIGESSLLQKADATLGTHLQHSRPDTWSCGEVMLFFLEYAASLKGDWSTMQETEQQEWLTPSVQRLNAHELYRTLNRVLGGEQSYGFVMIAEELQHEGFHMGRHEGRNSFSPADNDNHIYGIEKFGDRCYLVEQNVGRFHFGHVVASEDEMEDFAGTCCQDVEELRRMREKYGMSGLADVPDPTRQGGILCSALLAESLQPLYEEYYVKSRASTDYDAEGEGQMTVKDVQRVQNLRSQLYGLSYDFKKLDAGHRGARHAEAEAEHELLPGRLFYRDYPAHAAFTLYYHANT